MKKLSLWIAAASVMLSAALAVPASASVITFDEMSPTSLFGDGESFVSGGYKFEVFGDFAAVANQETFPMFGNAPTGNATPFMAGLNGNSIKMTAENGQAFRFLGADIGYIPPIGGFYPDTYPGLIWFVAELTDGRYEYGGHWFQTSDGNGDFPFYTAPEYTMGLAVFGVKSVVFNVCLFTSPTGCYLGEVSGNDAQFALDNLVVELIPEPGSFALVGLALGLAGALRRRQTI